MNPNKPSSQSTATCPASAAYDISIIPHPNYFILLSFLSLGEREKEEYFTLSLEKQWAARVKYREQAPRKRKGVFSW